MSQVTGYDDPCGIAMVRAHFVKCLRKASEGVEPAHAFAGNGQVNV
jgi:hypothetical protein